MPKKAKSYRLKNVLFLAISVAITTALARTNLMGVIRSLGEVGGFGEITAFLGGMMFVSTFTIAPAGLLLSDLATIYNPILISLLAGFGAMVSNLVMVKAEDNLIGELSPIFNKIGGKKISHLLHSPHFKWTLPVLGALIIASPFPDEIGVALMGKTRLSRVKFALLSFGFNTVGILALIGIIGVL